MLLLASRYITITQQNLLASWLQSICSCQDLAWKWTYQLTTADRTLLQSSFREIICEQMFEKLQPIRSVPKYCYSQQRNQKTSASEEIDHTVNSTPNCLHICLWKIHKYCRGCPPEVAFAVWRSWTQNRSHPLLLAVICKNVNKARMGVRVDQDILVKNNRTPCRTNHMGMYGHPGNSGGHPVWLTLHVCIMMYTIDGELTLCIMMYTVVGEQVWHICTWEQKVTGHWIVNFRITFIFYKPLLSNAGNIFRLFSARTKLQMRSSYTPSKRIIIDGWQSDKLSFAGYPDHACALQHYLLYCCDS